MKESRLFSRTTRKTNFFHHFSLTMAVSFLLLCVSQNSQALTKPTLQSPANNAQITASSFTFSWSHPYNDNYEVKIKTSGGTLKYASGKISSKSKTVNLSSIPLTAGSTYKWYVVVYANGEEISSSDSGFTYNPPVAAPVDQQKPVVTGFDVKIVGDTVTVSYKVTDSGGLKQVELWRSPNNRDWSEVSSKRQLVSGNSASGSFSDTPPSAGTFYYGVHVVDKAGNWNSEGGPKSVTVVKSPGQPPPVAAPVDQQKPVVTGFDVKIVGDTVTVSYKVTDSGGLKQVELWRSPNNRDWSEVSSKRQLVSGNSASGSFSDTPPSAGTFYYGVHVVDQAGNWSSENGPKSVTVANSQGQTPPVAPSGDKQKPVVSWFDVKNVGNTVSIPYRVTDAGGSGLMRVELWRSPNNREWSEVVKKRQLVSGNSAFGSFSDTPPSAGTFYYGVHVVDQAGNWGSENGPKSVTVGNSQGQTPLAGGETPTQKRIVAAAIAASKKTPPPGSTLPLSGQSSLYPGGWLTDVAWEDGKRMRKAISIYAKRNKKDSANDEQVHNTMIAAFGDSRYSPGEKEKLVKQIKKIYDGGNTSIPTDDESTLKYLKIQKQCLEWAMSIVNNAGGKGKNYQDAVTDGRVHPIAIKDVRPGMGYYVYKLNAIGKIEGGHAMIIVDTNYDNKGKLIMRVAESNFGRGFDQNPPGQIPWDRSIQITRSITHPWSLNSYNMSVFVNYE